MISWLVMIPYLLLARPHHSPGAMKVADSLSLRTKNECHALALKLSNGLGKRLSIEGIISISIDSILIQSTERPQSPLLRSLNISIGQTTRPIPLPSDHEYRLYLPRNHHLALLSQRLLKLRRLARRQALG